MSNALSPLHDWHLAHGARMEARGGWLVPVHYGSVEAEQIAAQTSVALGERVGVGVIEVVGSGIGDLAGVIGVGDAAVGTAAILASAAAQPTWCRLARDHARILNAECRMQNAELGTESPSSILHSAFRIPHSIDCLHFCDISSGVATLLVVGPRTPDLLARLVRHDLDPRVFAALRVVLTGAAGVPVQILRRDRGDLLAYELIVGRDVAEYFADTLLRAGEDLGLRLLGFSTLCNSSRANESGAATS